MEIEGIFDFFDFPYLKNGLDSRLLRIIFVQHCINRNDWNGIMTLLRVFVVCAVLLIAAAAAISVMHVERFESQPQRFAVVVIGECFRMGGQNSRDVDNSDAYDGQMQACASHVQFVAQMMDTYNMAGSVYLVTKNTCFNQNILDAYGSLLQNHAFIARELEHEITSVNAHMHRGVDLVLPDLHMYQFVMFCRVDLCLEPYLTQVLKPTRIRSKILYPSICWIGRHLHMGKPRVNDMFFVVHRKFYPLLRDKLLTLTHDSWYDNLKFVDDADMDVLLDTYHDSDSAKDWNPLYYIVNRRRSPTWRSKGKVLDRASMEPVDGEVEYAQ